MRTFFLLLGELVEACWKHVQSDPEALQLVLETADQVLTWIGLPDVIPGEPGQPESVEVENVAFVDLGKKRGK